MHYSLKDLTAHSAPWDLSWWVSLERGQDSEEEKAETRSFVQVSVAPCPLCVLANNGFTCWITEHSTWWRMSSSIQPHRFAQPTLYSLPTQATSFFPHYSEQRGKEIPPQYQHRESQRKLIDHCQWAEDIFTCPGVQRRGLEFALGQPGWSLLSITFLQRLAMDRNMHPSEHWKIPEERGTRALPASSGPQGGSPLFQATLVHGQPH